MRLQMRARNRLIRKLTLEWYASLEECCPPWWVAFPCSPWLWGFLLWSRGEKMWSDGRVCEWVCRAPKGGYFIDCESPLGVMTGWRTLLEYQAAGFSSRMRGVFIEQCLWFPNWRFSADFCAKGARVLRVRLRKSSRIRSKNSKIHIQKGIIAMQIQKLKFNYLLPKVQASLVQTNQKACLAQTGDGW
jgi:hypothetical protein